MAQPGSGRSEKPTKKDPAWYDEPTLKAIPELIKFRNELREKNLHDTEDAPLTGDLPPAGDNKELLTQRTLDGTYNDLKCPMMGAAGTRFGRNMPLEFCFPDTANLLIPNPRDISLELMTRTQFQPATIVNLLAAAWIQYETHDWFSHGRDERPERMIDIPLRPEDPWPEHPMQVPRTPDDTTWKPESGKPPTYRNENSHWWDGSQIYGSDVETVKRVRRFKEGKLKVQVGGRLPIVEDTGVEITGFTENSWVGLSILHALFALEHNAICDALRREYPTWDDEQLYQKARLINAALMAKIHTLEWTPAILPNPTTQLAMRVNWRGLTGVGLQRLLPKLNESELIGGIVGSATDHHTAPYSLTEEFVSVYRMHPLMPDDFTFTSLADGKVLTQCELPQITGRGARAIYEKTELKDLFFSFGISHPGAIRLHNYPKHLQQLRRDNGKVFDMAAVDILRDRERGVPRYNKFRELLRMPRLESIDEMTDNKDWAAEMNRVYGGNPDMVDLQVGLFAEPLPTGFGFSETAFRIFILMASRRLKSDRFLTSDYRAEVYTKMGLDWVENNGMKDLLLRHFPQLKPALEGVGNAFAPWRNPHIKK